MSITPGPWKFNPLNDTIEGKNREVICEFCFIKNVADVHALTAAPEMLEVIHDLLEPAYERYQAEVYKETIMCWKPTRRTNDQAEALLRRIEGEDA